MSKTKSAVYKLNYQSVKNGLSQVEKEFIRLIPKNEFGSQTVNFQVLREATVEAEKNGMRVPRILVCMLECQLTNENDSYDILIL
jgi:hypothetical protein